jgi:hypothetical protein
MPSNHGRNRGRELGKRTGRDAAVSVESLEGQTLLSVYSSLYGPVGPPVAVAHAHQPLHGHTLPGVVTKTPHFYQFYTGPKWAGLNAAKASVELSADGSTFTFTGTNQARINRAPAVYVWGIDRSPNPPPSPFQGRPNVQFDAVVVVRLDSSLTPSAQVVDLSTGTSTALPVRSASLSGRSVSVVVPSSLLPSTGLATSQYRFNYWPEDDGPPVSSSVASFAPENSTAQVG